MRKMTIERGYDPREFVVYAFGGAGPLHGGAFGRELGVKEILFPLGNVASAFSALGLAVSDLTTITQVTEELGAVNPVGHAGHGNDGRRILVGREKLDSHRLETCPGCATESHVTLEGRIEATVEKHSERDVQRIAVGALVRGHLTPV